MMAMTTVSRSFKAQAAADDLARGLPLASLREALGFLSCSPETDCRVLIARLQSSLPFPVVGCTTLAMPFESRDDDVSATLTVISRENLNFAISVSSALDAAEMRQQMTELYRNCEAKLGQRPKMLMAFLPLIPDLMPDRYLPFLFEAAGDMPVFGGVASDDLGSDRGVVLAEGRAFPDRMALVALGGDIKPVFAARCSLNMVSDYMPTVTEVDGYTLRRVDDISFCDYMARHGFDVSPTGFNSSWPLSLDVHGRNTPVDGLADACDLLRLNPADGSGTLSGIIPLGARVRIGVLSKSGIIKSADDCLADILNQIKDGRTRGYRYSALFCLPCTARYFAMVGDDDQEGEKIRSLCPEELSLFGYYGYGEICRIRMPDNRRENRIMNYSIVMCAF